jgi:hypothetical protein
LITSSADIVSRRSRKRRDKLTSKQARWRRYFLKGTWAGKISFHRPWGSLSGHVSAGFLDKLSNRIRDGAIPDFDPYVVVVLPSRFYRNSGMSCTDITRGTVDRK